MIASLPMYERAETRGAHDRLWSAIRENLIAVDIPAPEKLTRTEDPWPVWESPDLLLAQTCGLPYRARLADDVTLVGTPDYGLPDTPPGYYHSGLVARTDAHLGDTPVPAVNDALSQSGWAALYDWSRAVDMRLGAALHSGAHVQSARMVAEGRADLAAIDAVTWRNIDRYDPSLARNLSVIGDTPPTPGLPLITARPDFAARLFDAIADAISGLSAADRTATGLAGIVRIPSSAYLSMPVPPNPANS